MRPSAVEKWSREKHHGRACLWIAVNPTVTVRKTFFRTYWGSALGAIWLMCLGAALAVWAGANFDTIASLKAAGDHVFTGFGAIALAFSTLGLISVTALNMYGGSLTAISAIDSFTQVRPTAAVRIVTISVTAVLSVVPALLIGANFLINFEDFLLLVLYLFTPWTAVNLVDYYIVRRGHCAVAEIFNAQGCTGGGAGATSRPMAWVSRRCCLPQHQ
jgi:nucleobase:cation symporter-1, NCS1 family